MKRLAADSSGPNLNWLRNDMFHIKLPFPWKLHELLRHVERDSNEHIISCNWINFTIPVFIKSYLLLSRVDQNILVCCCGNQKLEHSSTSKFSDSRNCQSYPIVVKYFKNIIALLTAVRTRRKVGKVQVLVQSKG
jgi:hypothetical protein